MKKEKKISANISNSEDLLRSFCKEEIEVCKELQLNMFEITIGIEMGIAYMTHNIQKLKLEKKLSDDDNKRIYENFAIISKKIALMARNMIELKSDNRVQEIGLQIVQHNSLSPLFFMMVTSMMVEEKPSFIH